MSIVYNANIFQTTGENWDNVLLTLSNSNPLSGGTKPVFEPWYVNRGFDPNMSKNRDAKVNYEKKWENVISYGAVRGKIYDQATNEPIPFANIAIEQAGKQIAKTCTDFDGYYAVKPLPSGFYDVKVNSVGYNSVQMSNVYITSDYLTDCNIPVSSSAIVLSSYQIIEYKQPIIAKDQTTSGGTMTDKEISKFSGRDASSVAATVGGIYKGNIFETTIYDNRRSTFDGVNTKPSPANIIDDFNSNQLKATAVGIEYAIDIPYSIPCDGQDHTIKIRESQVEVSYVYYLAPKLDPEAFLTAELTDWSALNLLSGKVSLYFQGTFVGNSSIDMNYPDDTLKLSLGRDKSIICKRELNKEVFDKKIIGSNIREVIGYNITIRNNRNANVHIILEDQFPLSEIKSYFVELLDNGNASVDNAKGILKWDIRLNPDERKQIGFKYSVKYPK